MATATSSGCYQNSYTDYSCVPVNAPFQDIWRINPNVRAPSGESGSTDGVRRRGPSQNFVFPTKLYEILSRPEFSRIITWMKHGRSWQVVDKEAFTKEVMPEYFSQTKFPSFIRQVNGWGFRRITQGEDQNSYYHELFLRGMEHLVKFMSRHSVGRQEREPNLCAYPFLPQNPRALQVKQTEEDSTNAQSNEHTIVGNGHAQNFSSSSYASTAQHGAPNHFQYSQAAAPVIPAAPTFNNASNRPQTQQHHNQMQGQLRSVPYQQEDSYYEGQQQRQWHESHDTRFETGHQNSFSSSSLSDVRHAASSHAHSRYHQQLAVSPYSQNGNRIHHTGRSPYQMFPESAQTSYNERNHSPFPESGATQTRGHEDTRPVTTVGNGFVIDAEDIPRRQGGGFRTESSRPQWARSHARSLEARPLTTVGNEFVYDSEDTLRRQRSSNNESSGMFVSDQQTVYTEAQRGLNRDDVESFEQLSLPLSASMPTMERNVQYEDQNVNASELKPDSDIPDPFSRPQSSHDWDYEYAAQLSRHLKE